MASMNDLVDYLRAVDSKYDAVNAEYKIKLQKLREEKQRVRLAILERMQNANINGIRLNDGGRLETYKSKSVQLVDTEQFFAYVLETGRVDLLHSRVSQQAALDLLDNESVIPGVQLNSEIKLRVVKGKKS